MAGLLVGLTAIFAYIHAPYFPNERGAVGGDYALWLPDLLAGYYWHLNNSVFSLPWFSPAQCGGVPFYADPQIGYLSLPQFLTFVMPPVQAVQVSVLVFAAIGFMAAFALARNIFRLSAPASMLAGTVFMFNHFYAARMMVGHMTYQPFMLVPLLAAVMLYRPETPWFTRRFLAAIALGGLLIGIMIQAGAIHVLPPALLAVGILITMHAIRFGFAQAVLLRLGRRCGDGLRALRPANSLIGPDALYRYRGD